VLIAPSVRVRLYPFRGRTPQARVDMVLVNAQDLNNFPIDNVRELSSH
jgi:hypothetical protein